MKLTNTIISEFASIIVDNKKDNTPKESKESTVYGRVVGFNEIGGRPRVCLDGSAQDIPIRTTVKVNGPKGNPEDPDYYAGDRVLVSIKNHEALIVSNISTQMTTAEGAEDAAKQYVSDNGFIYAEKITGEQGDFYTLSADKFSATQITGALGHFITVNADKIITDAINAQIANIDTIKASDVIAGEGDFAYLNTSSLNSVYTRTDELEADVANLGFVTASEVAAEYLKASNLASEVANINSLTSQDAIISNLSSAIISAGTLNADYLKADAANIKDAALTKLFATSGILQNATILNGHVTGELDSVTLNANKITAGTLLVDRLYIKDQNNKWKMQTVDGQGQTVYVEAADRINERTITADKLVARSITANEIASGTITANEINVSNLVASNAFASALEATEIIANSITAKLSELDILNIKETLTTKNVHLGNLYFDQASIPATGTYSVSTYILGTESNTSGNNNTVKMYKLSSKTAVSGGTDLSLVTTGEKYTWNSKVAKSGDTMTGNLSVEKEGETQVSAKNTTTSVSVVLDASSQNHGLWSRGYHNGTSFVSDDKWMIYRGSDGKIYIDSYTIAKSVPSDAVFTDHYAWADITGKPSTYTPASGSTSYTRRDAWWNAADTHSVDDLHGGTTFVYTNHGAPVAGTMVSFDCSSNTKYGLQILGKYNGTEMYFRNRNGDISTWNAWKRVLTPDDVGTAAAETSATAATANTVAKRDSNGYLRATYYNTSCPMENIASYTANVAFIDSNGWLRKTSGTNFSSWLGLSTQYVRSTDVSGSYARINYFAKYTSSANAIITSGSSNYNITLWTSDRRLKKNIEDTDIDNALDVINQIQHRKFDWKYDDFGDAVSIGYVAQELEDVIPEAISKVPQPKDNPYGLDEMWSVDNEKIIPYLTKAIQELKSIIEQQQLEINKLKEEK